MSNLFTHHHRFTTSTLLSAHASYDAVHVPVVDDEDKGAKFALIGLHDARGDQESIDCYAERCWLAVGEILGHVHLLEEKNISLEKEVEELRRGMEEIGVLAKPEPEETQG